MDTAARHEQINAALNKAGIYTKGDIYDRLTRDGRTILWSVKGAGQTYHRVAVKRRRDGAGGYWIYSPDSNNAAHVRRIESVTDAEGIQAYLASDKGRTRKLWKFDRHGDAHPATY